MKYIILVCVYILQTFNIASFFFLIYHLEYETLPGFSVASYATVIWYFAAFLMYNSII